MRQLLDKGAPIDAKTADGDTPLSLAVSAGAVGSVGFLVKAGAALDLEDKVSYLLLLGRSVTAVSPVAAAAVAAVAPATVFAVAVAVVGRSVTAFLRLLLVVMVVVVVLDGGASAAVWCIVSLVLVVVLGLLASAREAYLGGGMVLLVSVL